MRKQRITVNKRSVVKMGAVLSLTVLMALQAVGCSPSSSKETTANPAAVAGQTETSASQGETPAPGKESSSADGASGDKSGDGSSASDPSAAPMAQGEGDSGTEPQPGKPLKEGNKAPDFTAQLIDGSSITLSSLKGKPVLINFWATWCGPCVQEMPAFERLQEDYGDKIGIIAVNGGEDGDTVKDFASENGYTFPIALDTDYDISMLYPTNSIPYTVVIDANGKITHISTGAYDADTMYERYKEALGL